VVDGIDQVEVVDGTDQDGVDQVDMEDQVVMDDQEIGVKGFDNRVMIYREA